MAERLLEGIGQIPTKIVELFIDIIDMIGSLIQAMVELCLMLEDFDNKIQLMTESCGSSEFTGMPIIDAIGCFRYMVGDVAFYMMYFTILIGCGLTIYKLIVLLYEFIDLIVEKTTGGSSAQLLGGKLSKLFKGY